METFMNMLLRIGWLAPLALAGFLNVTLPHAAMAVEPPMAAAPVIVAAPSVAAMPAYYYYHGRRYPYRYHGVYYGHRYYRGGHYHYY
jgi:hypothetical protein